MTIFIDSTLFVDIKHERESHVCSCGNEHEVKTKYFVTLSATASNGDIYTATEQDGKIALIKAYRMATQVGLKEAKEAVEALLASTERMRGGSL